MKFKFLATACLLSQLVINGSFANGLLKIEQPHAKATVAGAKVSAVFFKVTSPVKGKIIKAESPVAKITQLHEMSMEGNIMKMKEIPAILLQPNQPVELKAGGLHIMLIDLKQQLKAGEIIPIKLSFQAEGSPTESIDIKAEVKDLTQTPPTKSATIKQQNHEHNHH